MRVAVGSDSEEPNAANGSQNSLSLFIHFDHCKLAGNSWEFSFYEICLIFLSVIWQIGKYSDFNLSRSPGLSLFMASVDQRYMPTACEKDHVHRASS